MRGTIVGLNALTTVEGATGPGESGSILYASEVTVERELRANLTAELGFAAAFRDYTGLDGRDVILGAEAGATYWFNRYLGLTGRARHERLDSTLARPRLQDQQRVRRLEAAALAPDSEPFATRVFDIDGQSEFPELMDDSQPVDF